MVKIVHTEADVVLPSLSDNRGTSIDTEGVIKNINDLFEREDIKQLNAMIDPTQKTQKEGA